MPSWVFPGECVPRLAPCLHSDAVRRRSERVCPSLRVGDWRLSCTARHPLVAGGSFRTNTFMVSFHLHPPPELSPRTTEIFSPEEWVANFFWRLVWQGFMMSIYHDLTFCFHLRWFEQICQTCMTYQDSQGSPQCFSPAKLVTAFLWQQKFGQRLSGF